MARQGNGDEGSTDRVRVFLRIRPLTEGEKERGEEQVRSALNHCVSLIMTFSTSRRVIFLPLISGCVCVQNEESLMLKAPKDSQNMKCAERGVAQSVHKFSFSRVTDSCSYPT